MVDSYDHMMGDPQPAHMGSQSEPGGMAAARAELASKMRQDQAESDSMSAQDRDRKEATQNAYRSGDYKKGTYSPWHPGGR